MMVLDPLPQWHGYLGTSTYFQSNSIAAFLRFPKIDCSELSLLEAAHVHAWIKGVVISQSSSLTASSLKLWCASVTSSPKLWCA